MSSTLRIDGLAKILEIDKKDKIFFKHRKQLIGKIIKVHFFSRIPRGSPWLFLTGILQEKVCLNGRQFRKGGYICFRKVKVVPLPN